MPTPNFFSFFLAPKRMKKTTDARVSACLCTVLWFTLPLCLIFEYKRRKKKKKKKRATFPQLRPFLLLFQQNSTQSTIGFVNNKKSCNYFSFPFFIRFQLWEEEAETFRKRFSHILNQTTRRRPFSNWLFVSLLNCWWLLFNRTSGWERRDGILLHDATAAALAATPTSSFTHSRSPQSNGILVHIHVRVLDPKNLVDG